MAGRAIAGLAVLVAAGCGVLVLSRADEAVYGIPGWGVTATGGLLGAVAVGGALLIRSRASAAAGRLLLGVALFILGVLSIFSIGLLLLLAAVALLARSVQRPPDRGAAAGAVLVGAALPILLVFALAGPLVDCGTGTSGENLFVSGGGGGASSTSVDSPGGASSGRARGEDYEYAYRCRGGELVSFTLRRR